MPQKSSFSEDLKNEKKLYPLLDGYYKKFKYYTFKRTDGLRQQFQGIDVILTHKTTGQHYFLDEKAQLDYINDDLPTFAFELSYSKNGVLKEGWLFDPNKKTEFYALATGIYSDEIGKLTSCKLTLVNRGLLLDLLSSKGLSKQELLDIAQDSPKSSGKILLPQLDHKEEGYLFLSTKNKAEKPLNLVLRLSWLIAMKIGKRIS